MRGIWQLFKGVGPEKAESYVRTNCLPTVSARDEELEQSQRDDETCTLTLSKSGKAD